jgi:hypothetical protein
MGLLLGDAIPFLELVGRQSVPEPDNVYQSTIEIVKGHQDATRSIRMRQEAAEIIEAYQDRLKAIKTQQD